MACVRKARVFFVCCPTHPTTFPHTQPTPARRATPVQQQQRAGRGTRRPAPSSSTPPLPTTVPRSAAAPPENPPPTATPLLTSPLDDLATGSARKYVMVSGKGGVGKTSLSASLAVALAAEGHATLIVSTDPAHSLSDSLDCDVSGGTPVPVQGTDLPIWGLEIDPDAALSEWRTGASKDSGGSGLRDFLGGVGLAALADKLADLKLGDLLDTPPPGLDEAVAIAKVLEIAEDAQYARFTRVVIDTAPTGHTLRLLGVPDFVDAALGKLVRLRTKLAAAGGALRSLFGAGEQQDVAVAKLESLRAAVLRVRSLFRDATTTEFVIATIPTQLAIAESKRLLTALRADGVPCKRIIVNQVLADGAGEAFIKARVRDQDRALALMDADPRIASLPHGRAPMLDLEVRGVPAMRYFADVAWGELAEVVAGGGDDASADASPSTSSSSTSVAPTPPSRRRYIMLGGKGGVGKTSLSSALAVKYAASGLTTLVVSTDPAHSLSDSLDFSVAGGAPVRVTGPGAEDLNLWGLEVDVAAAKADMKAAAAADGGAAAVNFLKSVGLGVFADQLADLKLGELLDTPPPGVDEAVAIAKVVEFVNKDAYAHFDRIVFDTAPTGHTLRLLTLPDFVDATLGKVVRLRQTLTSAADAVKSVFGVKSEPDPAIVAAEALRDRTRAARALFRDRATTRFVIVTIPTYMAAVESQRLAAALDKEGVPIGAIVVNQVLADGGSGATSAAFVASRRRDQARALASLEADTDGLASLQVVTAPVVDLEVRGVAALRYFGEQAWHKKVEVKE